MIKPKTAFFDFACCEGCQLQVANLGESLLDVLDFLDVVEFREVMSEKWNQDLDIAVIEGSITNNHAVERIKEIREIEDTHSHRLLCYYRWRQWDEEQFRTRRDTKVCVRPIISVFPDAKNYGRSPGGQGGL